MQDRNINEEKDIIEDFDFEPTKENGEEMSLEEKLKALKNKLKEKTEEAKTNLDGWQRARAELVNKDKQLQTERQEIYKNATLNVLEEIIPVLDSFEMAMKNKETWENVDKNWRVGVEYIFSQLNTVCENAGLKRIEVKLGDMFNVNTMDAIQEVETDDESKDHTVSEVIQSGYELNGKNIREAKVKIFIKK